MVANHYQQGTDEKLANATSNDPICQTTRSKQGFGLHNLTSVIFKHGENRHG